MKTINMKLKKITKRIGGAVLAAAILLAFGVFGVSARADSPEREFPNLKATGSIKVTMKAAEDKKTLIGGGTLELYQLAGVVVDNGFRFTYTGDFAGLNDAQSESGYQAGYEIAVDGDLTADLAKKIYDNYVNGKTGLTKRTAAIGTSGQMLGVAEFTDLPLGLYLVVQTEAAENYNRVNPFLVTVPYYSSDVMTEDGKKEKAQYDVDAEPKTGLVPKLEPCKADPPVRKIVISKTAPLNQEFLFEFKRERPEYPMPVNADGKQVSINGDVQTLKVITTERDADGYPTGVAEAGDITFDKIGDYTYTYREVNDKKYAYIYDNTVYYIRYHVRKGTGENEGNLVIESVETWIGRVDGTPYKDTPYRPSANNPNFNDPTYASARVVEFVFYNEPGGRDRPPRDPDEKTPPTPNPPTDPVPDRDVLGAERDPGMPEQAVLGVDRLPQTGQLWWPVPVLLILGLALVGGGMAGRRRED